jgi:hypothetical protein
MGRRSLALGIRRRERGALLAALQDTASVSIFVGPLRSFLRDPS